MEYNDTMNNEKISAIKAQREIENLEELYRQVKEVEQQDDEEGNEEENNGNDENGESNGQQNKIL